MSIIVNFNFFFVFISSFFLITLLFLVAALEHFILVLIFLDLILLLNIILFVVYTQLTGELLGYNYALLLLGVAAADTAVGIGLFILYFKTHGVVDLK